MKINKINSFFLIIFLLISLSYSFIDFSLKEPVSIAAWNIHIFGPKKAGNETLMNQYYEIISQFDIVFLQEIRNADGSAIIAFCAMFNETHECMDSSRTGSENYKEQYLLLFDKKFELMEFIDYNLLNYSNQFFRPPIKAVFNYKNINFTIYGIHVRPSDASNEIRNLELLAINKGNVAVIGDLNSDCSYYKKGSDFKDWHWLITEDTTLSLRHCVYDQIIINENFYKYYIHSAVYNKGIDLSLSDHYLIYAIFELG